MSTEATTAPAGAHENDHGHGASGEQPNYLTHERGLKSWMFTLDHKRIGLMYLVSILAAFLLGGIMALLVRTELAHAGRTIMNADTYNQAFTLHGAIMVFLFIIPSIPGALGNFFLPIMLGTKDVAFPRLNLGSFYIYMFGTVFLIIGIIVGHVDTGWTFYTPYSARADNSVIWMTMGVFILGFSSILTGVNFIATVHTMRAPGMNWRRLPLFIWGIYATSVIQVLATPVLAITLAGSSQWRRCSTSAVFDPAIGGDPILFQHFFWFYSHPAVYIMILPGMAIVNEVIATFSRRKIFGYMFVAMSSVALALLGFLVWGHHMFTSGHVRVRDDGVLGFLTFLVAIPSGVKIFNWVATLYQGSISLASPMLYALAFLALFSIGGLTGLFLGTLSTGCAPARHLLRRCALPLRDGRRHGVRLPRWPALLVAEDDGPYVQRELGAGGLGPGLHRVQPHLLHAVRPRQPGHAPPLLRLPRPLPDAPYDELRRRVRPRRWLRHHGDHVLALPQERREGVREPVGFGGLRVAHHHPPASA